MLSLGRLRSVPGGKKERCRMEFPMVELLNREGGLRLDQRLFSSTMAILPSVSNLGSSYSATHPPFVWAWMGAGSDDGRG